MASVQAVPKTRSFKDADFKEQLQDLRRTDNATNWWYFARPYPYFVAVIGGAGRFDHFRTVSACSTEGNVPVGRATLPLGGPGQHHAAGLAHGAGRGRLVQIPGVH